MWGNTAGTGTVGKYYRNWKCWEYCSEKLGHIYKNTFRQLKGHLCRMLMRQRLNG